MKNIVNTTVLVFVMLIFSFQKNVMAQQIECPNANVQREIGIAKKVNELRKYAELSEGFQVFASNSEHREDVNLKVNKRYIFIFKTDKLIDQTGLSVLNSNSLVVASMFRETGAERNSIVMQYTPNFTGTYTMVLKTVDYTGRTVCGSWIIMEKDLSVAK